MKACEGDELPAVPKPAETLDVGFLLAGWHGRYERVLA